MIPEQQDSEAKSQVRQEKADKSGEILTARIDMLEQTLTAKLDKIEKKLAGKWVLPVALAILGAALTLGNFLITRQYNNSDLGTNKRVETIAVTQANSKWAFYTICKKSLVGIENQFEAFCKIDQSKAAADSLNSTLITFRQKVSEQEVVDQSVIAAIHEYHEFIAQNINYLATSPAKQEEIGAIFKKGSELYNDAMDKLTQALDKLSQR